MNPDSFPPGFQDDRPGTITGSAKAPLTDGLPLHASQDPKGPVAAVPEAKTGTPEEVNDRPRTARLATPEESAWMMDFLDRVSRSPDSNVEKVRELLLQRSLEGLKKYGCTTDRTDLSLVDWLRHRLEEVLDDAVYTMKIISELEGKA